MSLVCVRSAVERGETRFKVEEDVAAQRDQSCDAEDHKDAFCASEEVLQHGRLPPWDRTMSAGCAFGAAFTSRGVRHHAVIGRRERPSIRTGIPGCGGVVGGRKKSPPPQRRRGTSVLQK